MNAKNVVHTMSIMALLGNAGYNVKDVSSVINKVFGDNKAFEDIFCKVIEEWDSLDENSTLDALLSVLEGSFVAIKQDLEADAQRDKEYAS